MRRKFGNWSIIDRYIAGQVLFGLLVVSLILLGIAWFSQIIRLLSFLVNNNLSMMMFLRLTSLLLPDLIVIIMPVSLFAVVLFVYNRLVSDKELVIMESSGLTPKQLSRPALAVALLVAAASYFVTLYLSPVYSVKYRNFAFEARNDLSSLLVREGEFNQLTQGVTIYVRSSANNTLSDIFITDARIAGNSRTIIAERGIVTTTKSNIILALENGSVQEKSNGKYTFGNFDRYTADLGVISTSSARKPKADELGFFELIYARELGYADGEEVYTKYLAELHKRVLAPLYNVVLALVALISVFKWPLNRRVVGMGPVFAVVGLVACETFFISAYNLMGVRRYLWPFVYLAFSLIVYVMLRVLYSEREWRMKNPFRRG
ncbi:MAG: LptF/LptG family permease [Rickettsiales bacterium]|jgi:lipopolysaccharide export system permease protein|nr:LptF/LptG family permease [Rickettsiales bacterium]